MLGERLPARAGARVGAGQPRRRRREPRRGGGGARRAPGERADALLRRHQAPAQQLAVRAHGRAARARGADPAGDGRQRATSSRARCAFVGEAPARFSRTRCSGTRGNRHQARRARALNRIPAALGHSLSSTLAFFTPAVGRVAEREPDRQPVQDHAVHRARDLRRGRGRPRLRARQVPRAQGRGGRADPRQHAPGGRLDGRRRGDPGRRSRCSRSPSSPRSRTRPTQVPKATSSLATSGLLYASAERKLPPNGKSLNITVIGRQYIWQYVYPGANEPDGLGAPYSYEEMVVPDEHDRHAGHRLRGRRALLVGPRTRRQVPGRARLPQLHLVQDLQARRLPRPVRAAVRARSRAHDRDRQGRAARPVRSLAGLPEAADRPGQRRRRRSRAQNSSAQPAPDRSKTPRTSRRPATQWPPTQPQSPRSAAHRVERRADTAGRAGSRRPTTSGSGSCTWSRRSCSSASAASRR